MYDISADYMEVVQLPTYTQFAVSGVVGEREFSDDNILKGSLYISNQVSNGDSFTLGSAAIGELRATFINFPIHRRDKIEIWELLRLNEEEEIYDTIPMGAYTVSTATKTAYGVDVVAYDNMAKFDKSIGLTTTSGTLYQFARLACRACGVTLGMTAEQMSTMPNGNRLLTLSPDNDIVTWRDLLYWVAQTLCGIATIDRMGHLVFRTFKTTVDLDISDEMRIQGAGFSNLSAKYNGVRLSLIEGDYIAVIDQQADDSENIYDLGENPFMQGLSEETATQLLENIKDQLTLFDYYAFETQLKVGGFIDLFDVVECYGGILDEYDERQGIVMYYSWHYGDCTTIKCVRANVDLKVNQTRNQMSHGGGAGGKASEIVYESFQNASVITVADGGTKRLLNINFSNARTTAVIFQGEILLTSTATQSGGDTVVKVTYTIDESEEQYYYPTETWKDGKHMMSLMYVLTFGEAALHHFVADISCEGGGIVIPVANCRAVIYGQGLTAREGWNGILNLEDQVSAVPNTIVETVRAITGEVDIDLVAPMDIDVDETVVAVPVETPTVATITDAIYIDKTSLYFDGALWSDVYQGSWGQVYDEHLW